MARTKQMLRRAQARKPKALRVGTQSHAQHENTLVPAMQSAELPAGAAGIAPHEECQDGSLRNVYMRHTLTLPQASQQT